MKYVALLVALVFLAACAGTVYLYLTAAVTVEALGVEATEAALQPELFSRVKALAEHSASYDGEPVGEASDYVFYTYRFRVKNTTFVGADTVEVLLRTQAGDVMQVPDDTFYSLAARSEGDITATLLTRAGALPVRDAVISCYLWGKPQRIETTGR